MASVPLFRIGWPTSLSLASLQTLGTNGVCPAWCPKKPGPEFPEPKPYGVNYVGGTFRFAYTDLTGGQVQNNSPSRAVLDFPGLAFSFRSPHLWLTSLQGLLHCLAVLCHHLPLITHSLQPLWPRPHQQLH